MITSPLLGERSTFRPQLIQDLRERIQGIEAGGQRTGGCCASSGIEALDRLLPNEGLKRGTLIEWVSDGEGEGSGAATLALTVAAHLLREDGTFVTIDHTGDFYPPAAAFLGIPLERTILVRPENRKAALWAWEQALSCPGVTATFGWIDAIDDRVLRRLQLAAESGGGWGFLLRPPDSQAAPAWAATRIRVSPLSWLAATRRVSEAERSANLLARHLQVSLGRGQTIEVELSDEARDVSLLSELADPTAVGC